VRGSDAEEAEANTKAEANVSTEALMIDAAAAPEV
jgi:hypothetical protein